MNEKSIIKQTDGRVRMNTKRDGREVREDGLRHLWRSEVGAFLYPTLTPTPPTLLVGWLPLTAAGILS